MDKKEIKRALKKLRKKLERYPKNTVLETTTWYGADRYDIADLTKVQRLFVEFKVKEID